MLFSLSGEIESDGSECSVTQCQTTQNQCSKSRIHTYAYILHYTYTHNIFSFYIDYSSKNFQRCPGLPSIIIPIPLLSFFFLSSSLNLYPTLYLLAVDQCSTWPWEPKAGCVLRYHYIICPQTGTLVTHLLFDPAIDHFSEPLPVSSSVFNHSSRTEGVFRPVSSQETAKVNSIPLSSSGMLSITLSCMKESSGFWGEFCVMFPFLWLAHELQHRSGR